MRATQPVDKPGNSNVVPLVSPAEKAAPIYAERSPARSDPEAAPDLFRHGANLLQWVVLFGALGALLFGVRWWSGADSPTVGRNGPRVTQRLETPRPQDSTLPDGGAAAVGESRADGPAATPIAADAGLAAGGLDATGTSGAGAPASGDPDVTPESGATRPANVRTVRAPAEVPYPRKLTEIQPTIPADAVVQRGIVVLSLLIDAAGKVSEVEVLRGVDDKLDGAVVEAVRGWTFEPTVRDGRPVAVRGNFTVPIGY